MVVMTLVGGSRQWWMAAVVGRLGKRLARMPALAKPSFWTRKKSRILGAFRYCWRRVSSGLSTGVPISN
ncbi:hypothetical protein Nepgr_011787 [Nepenthes gracilis]|uniref:Uncharacterized protein n=1 Tax=Nepenthes gracilis TaxID=150966 RepID=A0AAD3XMP0_NEPGR|nr:hypothetical protein Nepgr_011787 [Nepenthes gracilis]